MSHILSPQTKYRSKFEANFASRLIPIASNNVTFEAHKLKYVIPSSNHVYTPDFHIEGTNIYFETKGKFDLPDRKKHILIKAQHPDKRIILVFQNPKVTLSKSSRTTYSTWCVNNDIEWMSVQDAITLVKKNNNKKEPNVNDIHSRNVSSG